MFMKFPKVFLVMGLQCQTTRRMGLYLHMTVRGKILIAQFSSFCALSFSSVALFLMQLAQASGLYCHTLLCALPSRAWLYEFCCPGLVAQVLGQRGVEGSY